MRVPNLSYSRWSRFKQGARAEWPFVIALLATALVARQDGWNQAVGPAFIAGLRANCPAIEAHDVPFLMRDFEARAELPADSILRQELREYDRLRARAFLCGALR